MIWEKEISEIVKLSPLNLSHFETLDDGFALRQHAIHGVPLLNSGYTVDDNARALVAMLELGDLFDKRLAMPHCVKILSFLNHMQQPGGWFHNLLAIDRRFEDSEGSEDCFGRAVWASGRAANSWLDENRRLNAEKMFYRAFPLVSSLKDPRPISFALLGLDEMAKAKPEERRFLESIEMLGGKLVSLFELNSEGDWHWFEDILTYDNARVCQAMFAAFQATGNRLFLDVAEKSFGFLTEKTVEGEMLVPVGQNGWFPRNGEKALFDQQPIEAGSMVQASAQGFLATSNDDYSKTALTCFNWFLGGNSLGAAVYDKKTGACFDGLTPKEANLNQGAESLVEFLLARLCIERLKRQKV